MSIRPLQFIQNDLQPGRRPSWRVVQGLAPLGAVHWAARLRRYCFYPALYATYLSAEDLMALAAFLTAQNKTPGRR